MRDRQQKVTERIPDATRIALLNLISGSLAGRPGVEEGI